MKEKITRKQIVLLGILSILFVFLFLIVVFKKDISNILSNLQISININGSLLDNLITIIAALISGAITLFGVRLTIKNEYEKDIERKHFEVEPNLVFKIISTGNDGQDLDPHKYRV